MDDAPAGAAPGVVMRGAARLLGGALVAVLPAARPAAVAQGSRVTGFVYDSVGHAPLANALVQLVPLEPALADLGRRTVQADAGGHFAVDGLPGGRYLVGFFHPKLDSLGIDGPARRLDLRPGRDASLDLAVPSAATVIAAWCGRSGPPEASGVVLGWVRDVHSATPLGNASVAAQWSAITLGADGARAQVQEAAAQANAAGWFGLCGVPRGGVLVLRARAERDSSALLELDVPDNGILLRDIALVRHGSIGSGAPPVLSGRVRDPNGEPLAGARVRLWGSAVETRTNDDGEFRLGGSTPGTQLIDARLIGYVPLRQVVDVSPESGARVELTMSDFPTEIDTVRVLAARPRARDALGGFERRRRLGHGVFLDTDQIEVRRPLVFTDLMRGLAGVEVHTVDLMSRALQMRASSGQPCEPALVIDGMRLPLLGVNLDDLVPADLVKAVEVYPRRVQAPPEYQATDCGSVVVWTGLRGWLAKRVGRKGAP